MSSIDLSTFDITFWAGAVAVLSVLLLVAIDRRKPPTQRHVAPSRVPIVGRAAQTMEVVHLPVARYKRTPLWRRAASLVEIGAISLVAGAVLAIVLATFVVGFFALVDSSLR